MSFKPEKPKKFIPKAFARAKSKYFSGHSIAFDQMKNCYAVTALPNVQGNERFSVTVSTSYKESL